MDCLDILERAKGGVNKCVVGWIRANTSYRSAPYMEASFSLSDPFHCHPNS
jgi:hypothetical protein